MNGIYHIETTKSELASDVDGFFNTLEEEKEALKECSKIGIDLKVLEKYFLESLG